MFGPIVGPLLGGWITDNWSWHWIFFINIPIGALSVAMTTLFIRDPSYMKRTALTIDYMGLIMLGLWVGCLQMILDRGQREDWFASGLIVTLAVVTTVALVLFVFTEISARHPIVDLGVFRDYSFCVGNVVVFFILVNLFGSIVLLPIYLQTLMGYTASLAGIVLGPGGVAVLVTMPVVGRLIQRVNPKIVVAAGVLVTAWANVLMSRFTLGADFVSIFWPRVVMGVGMGMIFIPLTTLTLSGIRREEMGNATSIFNLVRNMGGALGVAFVATMIARRSQFHQARLVDHMTSFDPNFWWSSQQAAEALQQKGMAAASAAQGGQGFIYEQFLRQSAMMSFNDVFHILAVLMFCMLPLVLFMRHVRHGPEPIAVPAAPEEEKAGAR
jgi:DHA2 family multidrug resistance protein